MKTAITRIAFASLLAAGAANAAPFSGKGLPADTGAVVHVDAESAANSSLFKAIRETFEEAAAKQSGTDTKRLEALKAEFGITDKSVTDATIAFGVIPAGGDKEPSMAVHLHGKFDQAKLLAIPTNHPEVKANKSGVYTYFSMADLDKAFGDKAKAKTDEQAEKLEKGVVCPVNAGTVIIAADATQLATQLKAIDAKSSYTNAGAKAAFAGSPMLGVYLPESFLASAKMEPGAPKPKSFILTAAETAGNFAVHAGVKLDSAAGAQKSFAQVQGMLGFLPMMLAQPKPDATAQEQADQAFLLSLVQALKVTNTGDTINADFAYSSAKLAAKIKEKKADIAAMAAQQGAAGAPSGAAPTAKRPARKVAPVASPVAAE